MELSPQLLVPLVIVAAAIAIFILRRLSEVRGPKRPVPGEMSTHQDAAPLLQGENRVLITHPLMRRAAERALAQGGESAKYIDRDGDRIYFNFGRIEDPVQRKNAVELIKGIQSGGQVDVVQVIRLIRRLFNKSVS
ncbi:MAG TPA: hypothetical protein VGL11_11095 [Candidatus Binatia bacterium]|jgi:hypothetical protein